MSEFEYFAFMTSSTFSLWEKAALWSVLGVAVLGLLYAGFLVGQVLREGRGTTKMIEIAGAIQSGANAYLIQQFKAIVFLILLLTAALYFTAHEHHVALGRACAFFMGACFSGLVGFIGMNLAVRGNLRVAAASRTSFGKALKIAYRTGTITGMLTDGLGLFGGTLIFMVYGERAYEVLLGFGFGGTLLALFMRVGGGIYTKAADVGADLVGKIEKGIPEDDPRNAATIADNVGDNVGDCAGMAADIFESYEVTIVSAMILGWASFGHKGVIFPLLVRAIGVVSSIIGTYAVRTSDQVRNAMRAINIGFVLSAAISIIGFSALGFYYLRFSVTEVLPFWATLGVSGLDMRPVWTTMVGILLAITVNRLTEYFTDPNKPPVQAVARSTTTGHATTIISGIAVGYESTVWAILAIAVAIFASTLIYSGSNPTFIAYGVAMCGIGMLTLTGNNISMDVFGPVSDNANGIGEMSHLEPAARQTLADLDAVGNTTKAITKGIAIASAVVAAVSLFNAYITDVGTILKQTYDQVAATLSVAVPEVFIGLLIGGAIPFLFSSLTIEAVGRAAGLIVHEVRAQFRDPAIWEGKKLPNYARVVSICTSAAQKELIGPALLAIVIPIVVGFAFGTPGLAGFLGGAILSSQLLAVFMANAGGAWDNAKKSIEDGLYGGKGSEAHKASVTGDTVGDPLKDTAGPALNPMIKVMNMVALLVVPLILAYQTHSTLRWAVVILGILIVAVAIRFPKRGFQAFVPEESQAPAPSSGSKKMAPAALAILTAISLSAWAEEPARSQTPASDQIQPSTESPSAPLEIILLNSLLTPDLQSEGEWLWDTTEVPEGVTSSHAHPSAKGIQHHGLTMKPLKVSADQMFLQQVWLDPEDPPQGIMLKFKLATGDEVGVYWEGEEEVFTPTEEEEIWYYGFLPEYGKWTPLEVLVEDLGLEEEEVTGISFITFDGRALWGKTSLTQAPPLEEEGESLSAIPNPTIAPSKNPEEVSSNQ